MALPNKVPAASKLLEQRIAEGRAFMLQCELEGPCECGAKYRRTVWLDHEVECHKHIDGKRRMRKEKEWTDADKMQWVLENGPVKELWTFESYDDKVFRRPHHDSPPWIRGERVLYAVLTTDSDGAHYWKRVLPEGWE